MRRIAKYLTILTILVSAGSAFSQTNVGGTLDDNAVWTVSNSPYIVDADLIVAQDSSLTIEPGVTVEFTSGTSMFVRGLLIADGKSNPDSVIKFTSNAATPAPGDWDQIEFVNETDPNTLFDYCVVEYGGGGARGTNLFYEAGAPTINISNSTIRYSAGNGVTVRTSQMQVTGSTFYANANWGIYGDAFFATGTQVVNTTIRNNNVGGLRIPNNALVNVDNATIDSNGVGIRIGIGAGPTITDSDILDNTRGIETLHDAVPNIHNNNFIGNTEYGVYHPGPNTIDARRNYWGDMNGPTNARFNPAGNGDRVTNKVNFEPFMATQVINQITTLNNDITVNTTLDSGIYVVNADISVNSGNTLTINPGVILKFKSGNRLQVNGVLHAVGRADSQVVFTSYKDDSYGGDTNGDTDSSDPSPGDWDKIYFTGNSGSILKHAIVKYGGQYTGMVEINTDNVPTIDSSYVSRSDDHGIHINGANNGIITNSYITGNNRHGVNVTHSHSDYSNYEFYNVVFQGNGDDGLHVNNGDDARVVEDCVFLYNGNSGMYVENGAEAQTIRDNEFRSNGDYGLVNVNSRSPVSPHEVVIDSNMFVDNGKDGMVTSAAEVIGNVYQNNTYPLSVTGHLGNVYNRLADIGNQTGPPNSFIDNRYNNALGVRDITSLSGEMNTVFPDSITSGTYVVTGSDVNVDDGATLEITPGVIIKLEPGMRLGSQGTLIAQGLPEQQIIFTSYRDSTYGGKTNAVSDTMGPAPGDWENVYINGQDAHASKIDYAKFLYGGQYSGTLNLRNVHVDSMASNLTVKHSEHEGILIDHSNITLSNCVVDSNRQEGVFAKSFYGDHSDVRITTSYIRDNGLGNNQFAGLRANGGSTFREISNNQILRNDGDGINSDFGVYPHSIVGNTIRNNSDDGMYVVTNAVPPKDVTITGNFVRNNGRDGIVSSGAHLTVNELEGNRYPISVTGRLGNYYHDENGDDENSFINNTYNNALGLRSDVDLSDTLSYDFPDSIDSHVYVAVDGDPTVDEPGVLTIDPGVTVKMTEDTRFRVYGKLVSVGTSDSMIVFTSYRDHTYGGKTNLPSDTLDATPGDWEYIDVNSDGHASLLRYTKFFYGGQYGQILRFNDVNVDSAMQNLVVRHSHRNGIVFDRSNGVLESCTIDSNRRVGVDLRTYYGDDSDVRIRGSYIRDNGFDGSGYHGLEANNGSGFREVSNTEILRNGASGIWTENTDGIPQTFVDNTVSENANDGIFAAMRSNSIDSLLTITGNTIQNNAMEGIVSSRAILKQNTISGNRYPIALTAQISDSGTVNESGNVYEDNTIEGNLYDDALGIRGDADIEGTLGGAWPDSVTSKTYVVINDVDVDEGTRLDVVPGTIVKFHGNTRLRSNGTLKAVGTEDNRIVFTSWKDDTFGGDTNADTTATSGGPDDWQDVYLNGSSSDDSHFRHAVIRFGGQSGQNLYLNDSDAQVDSSYITFSDRYGIYARESETIFYALELHDNERGLYVSSGYSNRVPEIHQSNIYNNPEYGVYNSSPGDTVDARYNYWGAATGPYHEDLNPSGEGNDVSDGVLFEPWLDSAEGPLLGDVSLSGAITAFDASLVLRHSVNALTLTGDSLVAGEVSANGTVGAYDASLILQYVAGVIITFPALGKSVPAPALAQAITMESADGDAGETVEIPINVNDDIDVISSELQFNYDPDLIQSISVEKTESTENMMLETRVEENQMKAALAGTYPAEESGPILNIVLELQPDVSDQVTSSLDFTKFTVNDIDLTTHITGVDVNVEGIPSVYSLAQNYPNPFNPVTAIKYQLPEPSDVSLTVYNLRGQQVAQLVDNVQKAGFYELRWDGTNQHGQTVSSGVYIYRLHARSEGGSGKEFSEIKKMTLIR